MATIELGMPSQGMQAELMGYQYQQTVKPHALFPLQPSAEK
jgi:hypothetical protein